MDKTIELYNDQTLIVSDAPKTARGIIGMIDNLNNQIIRGQTHPDSVILIDDDVTVKDQLYTWAKSMKERIDALARIADVEVKGSPKDVS